MVGRLFNLFRVPDIRHRLWVTFLFLVLYRVGMNVPLPGTNMPFLGKLLLAALPVPSAACSALWCRPWSAT